MGSPGAGLLAGTGLTGQQYRPSFSPQAVRPALGVGVPIGRPTSDQGLDPVDTTTQSLGSPFAPLIEIEWARGECLDNVDFSVPKAIIEPFRCLSRPIINSSSYRTYVRIG